MCLYWTQKHINQTRRLDDDDNVASAAGKNECQWNSSTNSNRLIISLPANLTIEHSNTMLRWSPVPPQLQWGTRTETAIHGASDHSHCTSKGITNPVLQAQQKLKPWTAQKAMGLSVGGPLTHRKDAVHVSFINIKKASSDLQQGPPPWIGWATKNVTERWCR